MAIEVTARGREREVYPFCRDGLAGAADELFECPTCATRTHAECRREAGRCTTAGCTGPPPGAAAEAARRRLQAAAPDERPAAAPVPFEEHEPSLALPSVLVVAGLLAAAASLVAGSWELAAIFVVWTLIAAGGMALRILR